MWQVNVPDNVLAFCSLLLLLCSFGLCLISLGQTHVQTEMLKEESKERREGQKNEVGSRGKEIRKCLRPSWQMGEKQRGKGLLPSSMAPPPETCRILQGLVWHEVHSRMG